MSEALLIAIITPIAGLISAIVLKAWEAMAKKKEREAKKEDTLRNECKEERDQLKRDYNELIDRSRQRTSAMEEDLRQSKMDYMELYQQFYFLRLAYASETQDVSDMNSSILGTAPHERREALSKLDNSD